MLSDDILYANVQDGLQDAPEKIKDIYLNLSKRYLMEALLLDCDTPMNLYRDLFGLSSLEVVDYKKYFYDLPPNTPRLDILVYINTMYPVTEQEIKRRHLMKEVFDSGWELLDKTYNKQRCFSLQRTGLTILKQIFTDLPDVTANAIKMKDLGQMKNIITMVKEGVKVETEEKAAKVEAATGGAGKAQQMTLEFVDKIQQASQANAALTAQSLIVGLATDEYGNVSIQQSSEINEALKDIDAIKATEKKGEK